MSYQQPPGGYPPQGGYQQPQAQPAYDPNAYRAPMAAGSAAPPAALIQLIGVALVALGTILRGIVGLMDPGKGAFKTYAVANLFMGLGLVALFYGLLTSALKEKEIPTGVRIAVAIVCVIVLALAINATAMGRGVPGID